VPPRLRPGDRVRLVSPSSFPSREHVAYLTGMLTDWGLVVEVGEHVFDEHGYMAGTDEDRLADLNQALRDPTVRAIIPTAGGAGAYRIIDGLDFEAARRDPKPVTGYSDTTNLHLALWNHSRVVGIHGGYIGAGTPDSMRRALMSTDPVVLHRNPDDLSAAVAVDGKATGFLMGGNRGWTVVDVLQDRLTQLDVPMLGGSSSAPGLAQRRFL